MDAKTYLESGILELYAAGALSLAESTEVESMASQHPEVAEELTRACDALAAYGASGERSPRPALRREILASINSQGQATPPQGSAAKPSASIVAYKYLLAACLASLVISTFASYFFYNRWSEAEDMNIKLQSEKIVLNQNYTGVKSAFDKAYSDMVILRDLQTGSTTLWAVDTTQLYAARVYWNPKTQETFLDIHYLPELPAGRQYQLWAMVKDKPVDAGVFDVSPEGGMQHMKPVFASDAWVVTIESRGGSIAPTLSATCLISK